MSDKMRKEFEAAMRLRGFTQFDRNGQHYQYDDIDMLWQGFRVGRASLVIELPDPGHWSLDRDMVIEAIHAAGVKAK